MKKDLDSKKKESDDAIFAKWIPKSSKISKDKDDSKIKKPLALKYDNPKKFYVDPNLKFPDISIKSMGLSHLDLLK